MPKNIIGHRVDVTDPDSIYAAHWGFVVEEESPGEYYVAGGSIGSDSVPLLSRRQFKVRDDEVITLGLPDPEAVAEYLHDVEIDWGFDPKFAVFKLREIPILDLERAKIRPLRLRQVDMGMMGKTKTKGPMVLDRDLSVIDGMHRLADAIAQSKDTMKAYVRVP